MSEFISTDKEDKLVYIGVAVEPVNHLKRHHLELVNDTSSAVCEQGVRLPAVDRVFSQEVTNDGNVDSVQSWVIEQEDLSPIDQVEKFLPEALDRETESSNKNLRRLLNIVNGKLRRKAIVSTILGAAGLEFVYEGIHHQSTQRALLIGAGAVTWVGGVFGIPGLTGLIRESDEVESAVINAHISSRKLGEIELLSKTIRNEEPSGGGGCEM